jgi:protein SCO1/2
MSHPIKPIGPVLFLSLLCAGVFLSSSCHRSNTPSTKRYALTGRVLSIDRQSQSAVIDGDTIPGFMDAMAMPYKIKPEAELSQLTPGDSISADVVVVEPATKNPDAPSEYWLENVKVTASGKRPTP